MVKLDHLEKDNTSGHLEKNIIHVPLGKKIIFHFELSSVSLHPSIDWKKPVKCLNKCKYQRRIQNSVKHLRCSFLRKEVTASRMGILELIQLKTLVADLSFHSRTTYMQKIKNIHSFLMGIFMTKCPTIWLAREILMKQIAFLFIKLRKKYIFCICIRKKLFFILFFISSLFFP